MTIKSNRIHVNLTDDQTKMITELKQRGFNISAFIRLAIQDKYNKEVVPLLGDRKDA